MAQLKVLDASKAGLFSFTALDTQAAETELVNAGWTHADALKHIDAAIQAGAYSKETEYPTRTEKVMRVEKEH